jgi:ATP-dependent DNA helicase DinG
VVWEVFSIQHNEYRLRTGSDQNSEVAQISVADALERATSGLPNRESRPGQVEMADAVARAASTQRHLVVQAGTGTGKSLGYLVPLLLAGNRVVVATATKALQDQLATRDLPMLAERLGVRFTFALLKGRSNYLCRQRALEVSGGEQLSLEDGSHSSGPLGREVRRLLQWATTSETGERGELPFEPSPRAWAQVSVGHTECPGATRCPSGQECFAEAARQRAGQADVVVVNTHLYAFHLLSGGGLLPEHDVVVIDEAHELEDIASASLGFAIAAGRIRSLARAARSLVAETAPLVALDEAADALDGALAARRGARLSRPIDAELAQVLTTARERVSAVMAASRHVEVDDPRRARVLEVGTHLITDLDGVLNLPEHQVAWVEGERDAAALEVAPIDVGAVLDALWWSRPEAPTAVLTSATIPVSIGPRLGLAADRFDQLDVGSPFDYANAALLYCARHLPDPREPSFTLASHEELEALIDAAGGRTMALFTSWRAMQAAAAALAPRLPYRVLTQADLPKSALVEQFRSDEQSCLFATMGFWQGVDVPGPALSLVVLDRIPFPRPDDPLLQARRDRLGRDAFRLIDLPRAATLLAQGAGRLIRSGSDRGVVAVLDRRLSTARYGWDLVQALPPMRRTRERADVAKFLSAGRAGV